MSYFTATEAAEMLADAASSTRRELFAAQPPDRWLSNATPGERLAKALDLSDMCLALAGYPIDRHVTEGKFWL